MAFEYFLYHHRIWLELLTAVGTVGATAVALFVSVKNNLEFKKEKLSGIAITGIDKNAVATLENNAKFDVHISVKKYQLTVGENKNESLKYLKMDIENLKKEVGKINNWNNISSYSLNSQEKVQFHFSDIVKENVYATLVVLRVSINKKKIRYYLLRFAGSKATESDFTPYAHPIGQWITATSFE